MDSVSCTIPTPTLPKRGTIMCSVLNKGIWNWPKIGSCSCAGMSTWIELAILKRTVGSTTTFLGITLPFKRRWARCWKCYSVKEIHHKLCIVRVGWEMVIEMLVAHEEGLCDKYNREPIWSKFWKKRIEQQRSGILRSWSQLRLNVGWRSTIRAITALSLAFILRTISSTCSSNSRSLNFSRSRYTGRLLLLLSISDIL